MEKGIEEKIEEILAEIRRTPYHKGTEHHIGILRAKLARLRFSLEKSEQIGKGGSGMGYAIKKGGNATCVLVGPPSVGKSTLLNVLTNAFSETGEYDFTTLDVIPGMMDYQGAKIQILDLPGLVKGAALNKGKGKRVLSVVRAADLVLIVVDPLRFNLVKEIKEDLALSGIRLGKKKPKIEVIKTCSGGIKIKGRTKFNLETVVGVANEFGFRNAEVIFQEDVSSLDELIDVFAGNRVYLPEILVLNKSDLLKKEEIDKFKGFVLISAGKKAGLEKLKEEIWKKLGLIRVFLKPSKEMEADMASPLVVKEGFTAGDVAKKFEKILFGRKKQVCLWGKRAKFPGQLVPLEMPLSDGDIIFFE